MTPININPRAGGKSRSAAAADYCRSVGFDPDDDAEALRIATQLQQEFQRRALLDSAGNYHVPPSEGRCEHSCGGWDGVSERCDCGRRRLAWRRRGTWPSAEITIAEVEG